MEFMRLQCSGTDYRPTAMDGWIGKESRCRMFLDENLTAIDFNTGFPHLLPTFFLSV
jgi:hypothetical protein